MEMKKLYIILIIKKYFIFIFIKENFYFYKFSLFFIQKWLKIIIYYLNSELMPIYNIVILMIDKIILKPKLDIIEIL